MEMDFHTYAKLTKSMYINISRDELAMMGASAYPNLKESSQKDYHKKVYKRAYPIEMEVKNVVKLGDIKKVLS